MLGMGKKSRQLVGLDIGSSSIKSVELKSTKAGYELVSFGMETLAQDTVVDGAIMDAPQVANAISKIFDAQRIKTKNVATFALLFGTTWFVNALVFAGVLVIVLAAVETTRKFRTPSLPVVYAGIAASLALAWVIRPEWLLPLPFVPRLLAASLLAFLPIYLANVAFSKRFGASDDSRSAFGLNLLGAMLGGCLEYMALLTGYRNLLLVVAGLYLLAFLLAPRKGLVAV